MVGSDWSVSVCSNEFSQMVAEEYLSHFNFSGLTIDQALRSVTANYDSHDAFQPV